MKILGIIDLNSINSSKKMFSKIAKYFFRKAIAQQQGAGVPTLDTGRLTLRAPNDQDYDSILRLGSDPEVMRYITYGKTQSPEEARKDLERRIQLSRGKHGYWIAEEKYTKQFVGWFTLKPLENQNDFEIGYRLLREHWGKGYATEGSKRLLQYAFHQLQLKKVLAIAMPENSASRRVMEKLGLKHRGNGTFYGVYCVIYHIHAWEFFSSANEPEA